MSVTSKKAHRHFGRMELAKWPSDCFELLRESKFTVQVKVAGTAKPRGVPARLSLLLSP